MLPKAPTAELAEPLLPPTSPVGQATCPAAGTQDMGCHMTVQVPRALDGPDATEAPGAWYELLQAMGWRAGHPTSVPQGYSLPQKGLKKTRPGKAQKPSGQSNWLPMFPMAYPSCISWPLRPMSGLLSLPKPAPHHAPVTMASIHDPLSPPSLCLKNTHPP